MKHVYRSRTNRIVGGLLGGIGEYFAIDPVLVRLVFIAVLILTAVIPCAFIYFLGLIVVPLESDVVIIREGGDHG